MKSFVSAAVLGAFFVSVASFATSPLPREIAATLVEVPAVQFAKVGRVLKRNKMFPRETILVGITAKIALPNACTSFVGQQALRTSYRPGPRVVAPAESIKLVGSVDPLIDACIEIAVVPFDRIVTIPFIVNNETVPSQQVVQKILNVANHTLLVRLDTKSEIVTVQPIKSVAR